MGTFNEEILGSTLSGFKLNLNTNHQSSVAASTGPSSVMFTYTVQSGDNTESFDVNGLAGATAVTDRAGNVLDTSRVEYSNFDKIKLDTKAPDAPTIHLKATATDATDITLSGAGTPQVIYDREKVFLVIDYDDTETAVIDYDDTEITGVKKYTTNYQNAQTIWADYSTKELGNGEYIIYAYQQDLAGNKTEVASQVRFNIDYGHILQSVKINKPADTYGVGTNFVITWNFRNEIKATAPQIIINVSNGAQTSKTVNGTLSDDKKTLTFEYTVISGDSCPDGLEISKLKGTFKDKYDNDISSYITLAGLDSEAENFNNETEKRKILTGNPVIQNIVLDGPSSPRSFALMNCCLSSTSNMLFLI